MIKKLSELSPEQALFFNHFNSYRSFARKEQWPNEQRINNHRDSTNHTSSYETMVEELIVVGLLKKNKAGAVSLSQLARVLIKLPYGSEAKAGRELNRRSKDSSYFNR